MLPWEVTQVLAPERESPVALNMVIAQDTEYVLLDEPPTTWTSTTPPIS